MKTIKLNRFRVAAMALAAVSMFAATSAWADRKAELQERFKARLGDVQALKGDGKVGETTEGLLGAVKESYLDDAAVKKLVGEENSDRQELYKLIAEDEKTTEAQVAERAARRAFERAKRGEYLRTRGGEWKKKE